MTEVSHYGTVADLFDYPGPSYFDKVKAVRQFLAGYEKGETADIDKFIELLPTDLEEMRELYTRSFDVQSITTLDLGFVLFGDDYKRGELLANLTREHRETDNFCGTELADHLPNILRLISKLNDRELVHELVQEIVAPALKKMIGEFDPKRIEKREVIYKKHYKTILEKSENRSTLYVYSLKALYQILSNDFVLDSSVAEVQAPIQTSSFLNDVGREMKIEAEFAGDK